MIVKINDYYTTLIADEGMMLYRESITTDKVDLGCNDSKDNWKEITIEEAMLIQEDLMKNIPEDLLIPEDLIV